MTIREAAPIETGHLEPARRARRIQLRRPDAISAWLVGAFALGALFYLWTTATAGDRASFYGDPLDYYGLLTTALLHGHLYVPLAVPQGLLALKDPFNPVLNSPWNSAYHDLAVYHGHFYLDWGPTPALTLYLPWRIVGLGDLAESWAVWIYSTAGLAAALGLLRHLQKRFAPSARTSRVAWAALALVASTVVPFVDRTPDVYEVAVASAYCCMMLGLYLLASGALSGAVIRWRVVLGSLLLGLAAGARWDLLFLLLLLPLLAIHLMRRAEDKTLAGRLRVVALAVLPGAAFVLVLLVYNVVRFGSPLEVGTSYQLAGFDPTTTRYYLVGYLWPSLYYYLVAPIRFSLNFPFVWLPPPPSYPGGVPASYAPEMIGGILETTPILLAWIPLVLFSRRIAKGWRGATLALGATAALIVFFLAFGVPGGSMRYEVDFEPLLLVPALLCFLRLEPKWRWLRRVLGVLGAAFIAYGALVGVAISLSGYHDQIEQTDAGQVAVMRRITQPFVSLVVRALNHPVLVTGGCDAGFVSQGRYDTLGIGTVLYGVIGTGACNLDVLSPSVGTWNLAFAGSEIPNSAIVPNGHVVVTVTDATGRHAYTFPGGTASLDYPLHLHAGTNLITMTANAPSRTALPPNTGLVSFSDLVVRQLIPSG